MYQVILTGDVVNQSIAKKVYGEGYFPQKFTFTRDAKILLKSLQDLKVSAKMENEQQAKQSVRKAAKAAIKAKYKNKK